MNLVKRELLGACEPQTKLGQVLNQAGTRNVRMVIAAHGVLTGGMVALLFWTTA
jgi:hypothetical protein